MHDIKAIRADPEAFAALLSRRQVDVPLKRIMSLDAADRALSEDVDQRSAELNILSHEHYIAAEVNKRLGQKIHELDPRALDFDARLAEISFEIKEINIQIANRTQRIDKIGAVLPFLMAAKTSSKEQWHNVLTVLPNCPSSDVPDGSDETGNRLIYSRGTQPNFAFTPLEHDTLAHRLGYDPDAAAAIAGSRFAVLKGPLARLHRALGQYMIDVHTAEHGYTEVAPPLLVREAAVFGVGQLPKFEEDLFKTTDGRYLISTAEVVLTNLVREQIVDLAALPLRFTALTPCFRSEAGSAGRDTRGLIRQHQFDKVELVSIVAPEAAADEHERMTACAETILDRLGLAYRRMLLCAGDMGFAARKTYDLEVWLPGQGQYREISSCSDCGDFQARRMNTRYRAKGEKGSRGFVHTLNGSALAVGRTLVAVLENYQRADGSVHVPDVLHPYMGGVTELIPNG